MELPAPGVRHDHRDPRGEGETVTVGQVIARMTTGAGGRRGGSAPKPATAHRRQRRGRARSRRHRRPTDANASPVARRVAAAEGVDLAAVDRHRPRRPDHQGRRAAPPATAPAATAAAAARAGATLIKGGGAALARYMDESRSIPTATSFRTLAVTTLDARRKQLKDAGQQGLVHAPDRVRDRARGDRRDAGDGPPLRRDRRQSPTASTTAPSTSASPSTSRRRTAPGR